MNYQESVTIRHWLDRGYSVTVAFQIQDGVMHCYAAISNTDGAGAEGHGTTLEQALGQAGRRLDGRENQA